MKVLYVRISSIDQRTDRQRVNENDFDLVIEDIVSGSIPFQEREGGRRVLELLNKNHLSELSVWQIDRIGRDIRDIINTLHRFSTHKVCVYFINQGLKTLDVEGNENPVSKMVINLLGIVADMERTQILERQRQGIAVAKARNVYKGRKTGTQEDVLTFLSKPRNKRAIQLLKNGYKAVEVSKITELHPNTITKIKKCMTLSGVN
jgi:DNA invertase Pin-like site-specific DNA recombinase